MRAAINPDVALTVHCFRRTRDQSLAAQTVSCFRRTWDQALAISARSSYHQDNDMERKTETNDSNKDSLNTSLTSVGQLRFDTRGPNATKRRSWSETMKLSDEVLPSQPRRVSAPSIYY